MNLHDYGYSETYSHQCAAWTNNPYGRARKQCALPVTGNIDGWIYLCSRHHKLIEREFERSLDSLNARRIENLQQQLEEAEEARRTAEEGISREQIRFDVSDVERKRKAQTVYFIRCQQYIKIGIARNPAARLKQIRRGGGSHFPRMLDIETAELVATEPGGLDRERELHKKFHKLRHTGEWFKEAPELLTYIKEKATSAATLAA